MFRALFARLTGNPRRGQAVFELATAESRKIHWFVEGQVPDTVNGRFAVLATIVALVTVRLEREGESGREATVALTERLVETLDTELREMGLGDPTLGKQVRQLVGAVSGRVERWRLLCCSDEAWTTEVERSLYLEEPAAPAAVSHSESQLKLFWHRLEAASLQEIAEGRLP